MPARDSKGRFSGTGAAIRAEVRGLRETQRKLEQVVRDLEGNGELFDGIRKATLMVMRDARILAPVHTGRLRASITPEVRRQGLMYEGVVGTNVVYAPYMELGTGTFVGRPAYFPPVSALQSWASRHGINAFVVARAIYRRGGLKGRKFLQGALDQNRSKIESLISDVVMTIVNK